MEVNVQVVSKHTESEEKSGENSHKGNGPGHVSLLANAKGEDQGYFYGGHEGSYRKHDYKGPVD